MILHGAWGQTLSFHNFTEQIHSSALLIRIPISVYNNTWRFINSRYIYIYNDCL